MFRTNNVFLIRVVGVLEEAMVSLASSVALVAGYQRGGRSHNNFNVFLFLICSS